MYTTLIQANELASHLNDSDWVILDCRHDLLKPTAGSDAFAAGHIQNAQFADIDTALSAPKTARGVDFTGRHPLPDRNALLATLRGWGINDDTQVVAYDGQGGMFAARLWWLLRWLGHPAVAVLDGGLAAWQAQGLPLVTPVAPRAAGKLTEKPSLTRTVSVQELIANLETQALNVIDARAPDRYRGENETIDPVGGHIPGAKNRFFKDNLQADGRFKSADELQRDFSALIASPQTAVMQCGSGVTACHNLLALEVAGLPGAALYPGSWSEWCADPARPVATGN
ncbi:thiosulfate/3-mercaptopyruvate sulfurtransferase [Janthinobacterium sp. 61]|uniref:sulfurtransferase n=1 Tax=Janthinobacterium sp. 61 TaxID=2035209 RepID=UPI000C712474|nr:sulfurtransferase [Janthinobacterium sp. 61]PKV47315.1 thiosulfate/3-mercaptopyruvate sulfurtransferase [Janthinobacterium sp. 61]